MTKTGALIACTVLAWAAGAAAGEHGGAEGHGWPEGRGRRGNDEPAAFGAGERSALRTRLLMLPDGRPVPAGGGYVALHDLFLPAVTIGIGPFCSVTGGATLAPWLERQSVLLSGHLTPWAVEDLAVAAGAAYFGHPGDEAGAAFAAVTGGGVAGSGTAGVGWGFAGEGWKGKPVFRLGFRSPFSGELELVGEAWFPPSFDPALLGAGLRYTAGRVSIDLAALFASRREDGGPAPLLPMLTFAFGF